MSHVKPGGFYSHTPPVKIPPAKATYKPPKYIKLEVATYFDHKMVTPTTKLSMIARALMNLFDDLPLDEILAIEQIMIENEERDVDCWLVDQITNWVYEDTEMLMPVSEAYRLVKLGQLNE